ncbi:MAG: NTPase [Promethearchaeota archaeon]
MNAKILITGPPRCGKSTLISKLINYYSKKNYIIRGFLTPEVKKDEIRIGFDVINILTGKKARLARIGSYKTRFKLGKYKIFIDEFEEIISNLDLNENEKRSLIIIDEIGKMELFSIKFQNILKRIFNSNISILATIGQKLSHPLNDYILKIPGVVLFNLTSQNQQKLFQEIISILKKTFSQKNY